MRRNHNIFDKRSKREPRARGVSFRLARSQRRRRRAKSAIAFPLTTARSVAVGSGLGCQKWLIFRQTIYPVIVPLIKGGKARCRSDWTEHPSFSLHHAITSLVFTFSNAVRTCSTVGSTTDAAIPNTILVNPLRLCCPSSRLPFPISDSRHSVLAGRCSAASADCDCSDTNVTASSATRRLNSSRTMLDKRSRSVSAALPWNRRGGSLPRSRSPPPSFRPTDPRLPDTLATSQASSPVAPPWPPARAHPAACPDTARSAGPSSPFPPYSCTSPCP